MYTFVGDMLCDIRGSHDEHESRSIERLDAGMDWEVIWSWLNSV